MFYEARTHQLLPVADAAAAATLLKEGKLESYKIPMWQINGVNVLAVNDAHPEGRSFEEVALIKQLQDGSYYQVESITAAWCTNEQLTEYFANALKNEQKMGKADLIIGEAKGDETAWFNCGCCGNGFTGNVKKQHTYGQDAGYGICQPCATRFYD